MNSAHSTCLRRAIGEVLHLNEDHNPTMVIRRRDVRVHEILEGTHEVMQMIVARRALSPGVLEGLIGRRMQ